MRQKIIDFNEVYSPYYVFKKLVFLRFHRYKDDRAARLLKAVYDKALDKQRVAPRCLKSE